MFNNFMQKAHAAAEKAAAVAADLDKKIDASIGIEGAPGAAGAASSLASSALTASSTLTGGMNSSATTAMDLDHTDDGGAFSNDDAWADDFDVDLDVSESAATGGGGGGDSIVVTDADALQPPTVPPPPVPPPPPPPQQGLDDVDPDNYSSAAADVAAVEEEEEEVAGSVSPSSSSQHTTEIHPESSALQMPAEAVAAESSERMEKQPAHAETTPGVAVQEEDGTAAADHMNQQQQQQDREEEEVKVVPPSSDSDDAAVDSPSPDAAGAGAEQPVASSTNEDHENEQQQGEGWSEHPHDDDAGLVQRDVGEEEEATPEEATTEAHASDSVPPPQSSADTDVEDDQKQQQEKQEQPSNKLDEEMSPSHPSLTTDTASVLPEAQPQLPQSTDHESNGANDERVQSLENTVRQLQEQLHQREEQLVSKTEQLMTQQSMFETEKQELIGKVTSTKDEAKRRLGIAKERVEAMEQKLRTAQAVAGSSAVGEAQQAELIQALRSEGEQLAMKQSEMELAVRAAKTEARELRNELEEETTKKEDALEKIASLEADLKSTKESLASARRGESQAGKLENHLQQSREETEKKAASILSLEQQVKEYKATIKELNVELEAARKGAAVETEREQKKLRKEHNDVASDLEAKLRTSEREAAVREDALRHEVAELRKRWQDAVRRADSLSMDVQSSTAPLLRQLESMEKQNRARVAGWAELETKLRSELEETVIANEKLAKERSEYKTKYSRLERTKKENDDELKTLKISAEDKATKVTQLEEKLHEMETEGAKMKEEWAEVERLANEGVARVRSEMTQTVVESEERYRSQVDAAEKELRQEREKRRQLEQQVEQLVENAGVIVPPTTATASVAVQPMVRERKPKKLKQSEGQAEILAGALNGLGGAHEDDDDDDEYTGSDIDEHDAANEDGASNVDGNGSAPPSPNQRHRRLMHRESGSSFAALEELSSRLKVAKVELTALRKSLAESEKTREKLVAEVADSRSATEKLPLFEAKVNELTAENQQQALEIQALQDDIAEVRELYRGQLNALLEEKAAVMATSPPSKAVGAAPTAAAEAPAPGAAAAEPGDDWEWGDNETKGMNGDGASPAVAAEAIVKKD